jgi:hypothetical protein
MSCSDNFSYGRSIKQGPRSGKFSCIMSTHILPLKFFETGLQTPIWYVINKLSKLISFLWDSVRLIYIFNQDTSKHLSTVRAHDTRKLATSWALFNGASITEIIRAAHWASESTFTSFTEFFELGLQTPFWYVINKLSESISFL